MAAGGGGAWKVAFADFMTAMMALFLVLWISAQDKKILIATSRYFQSPFSSPMEDHSGIMPFNKQNDSNNSPKEKDDSDGAAKANSKDKQVELSFLNSVAADFYRLLHLDQNLDQKPIDVQVTSDGLRITPVPLTGAVWPAHHDHRMATTGALIGLRVPGVEIDDIGTTAKTLPEFTMLWERMLTGATA